MILTDMQKRKVEENLGLVGKVIKDKVHGVYRIYGYDDLFQIGCIGLCKAAATDRGGVFSTYAYNIIWHEICDALRYAARREAEELQIAGKTECTESGAYVEDSEVHAEIIRIRKEAVPTVRRGIDVILLMEQGYNLREIGMKMGASPNLAAAWASKARKKLRQSPQLRASGDG